MFRRNRTRPCHLRWWTPLWSGDSAMRREGRQISSFGFVLRVSVVSALVGAAILVGFKLAFPMLAFGFLWRMIFVMPGVMAYLWFMSLVLPFVPKHVEVRRDRIVLQQGQSACVVQEDAVESIKIVVFAPDRIRLRIIYLRNGVRRSAAVAVGRKVNLDALCDLLPVAPVIRDARGRAAGRHPFGPLGAA